MPRKAAKTKIALSQNPKLNKKQDQEIQIRSTTAVKYESTRDKIVRRFRPGEKAIKELKQYNRAPSLLIRKLPFQRLVRDVASNYFTEQNQNFRWTPNALSVLQGVSEDYMVSFFEDAYACALHAKRVTLLSKDMALASRIRGTRNITGIHFK
ncbi:hypothetical protein IMG5_165300 [Ichthyophthirius multifiliis]|uniref:Core Histone H2A/H2B/H3 domain-containing protein n=1 Tax=Ichthyophthirius multifiliis TaxID=5932 RepID=G0R0K0_ICHMU|nr:hypothetical protein IMG5_165300 [Ichthyophthirius multifiliis]EGR28986.1 hypothetical protein IMG5_165300 [Ichthyophthirius multifiliis]|eukprot:XP_004030222.1 hypothetical protein IMG5_165300 [Ichthyophthirius multifiliis]